MEFRIEVARTDDGWRVSPRGPGGEPVRDPATGNPLVRELLESATKNFVVALAYPLLSAADLARLAPTAPHRVLCVDADAIAAAHQAIADSGQHGAPDMVTFGRYLFELLIGDTLWTALNALATPASAIELSLMWNLGDTPEQRVLWEPLQRLPWEMMHNGARFLGQEGRFAIVRRIAGAMQPLGSISSPPRVLFVVGTELHNDVIRPGAEYLRLLQGLRVAGLNLSLRTRLLLRTTPDRLEAALDDFHPDIVHFICHGFYDEKRNCYLQLVDNKDPQKPWRLYAGALAELLRVNSRTPSVVVLSACYTAAADMSVVGQVAAPLAADLVSGGVPVAVGMAGPITDQACRLFTRRFYEALLANGDFAHAAAEGRRAAIRGGGTDPALTVDWTMPTVFLAEGVRGTSAEIKQQTVEQQWHNVAAEYAPGPFPVFCDRLEIVEWFDTVLAGETMQRATVHVGDLQILAVASRHPDTPEQYGRTWLLKELAAKAIRDGHFAVMVERKEVLPTLDWPKTGRQLATFIYAAVGHTLGRFRAELGLSGPLCPQCPTLRRVLDVPPGQDLPGDLPQDVLDAKDSDDSVLAVALRLDMEAMLQAARGKRPDGVAAATRLVILIDDVHKMGKAAVQTLQGLCGPLGLRALRRDVRIVLMYSAASISGQDDTIKAITDWLGQASWAHLVELDGFRTPYEDREAYEYFLLNWAAAGIRQPLMVSPRDRNLSDSLFSSLKRRVAGVPSRLAVKGVDVVETFMQDVVGSDGKPVLQPADDEAALLRAQNAIRGGE